jgi:hypothetical protein
MDPQQLKLVSNTFAYKTFKYRLTAFFGELFFGDLFSKVKSLLYQRYPEEFSSPESTPHADIRESMSLLRKILVSFSFK